MLSTKASRFVCVLSCLAKPSLGFQIRVGRGSDRLSLAHYQSINFKVVSVRPLDSQIWIQNPINQNIGSS